MKDTDKIKQKIDIVELINEFVPLKKTGRNFSARCPFHAEKTPSFIVSPERQTWHCFGACSEGGDIFSFYMKIENISFPEALEDLAKRAGVSLQRSFEHDDAWQSRKRLYDINHLASEYYHYILTKHTLGASGRDYQKKRGISDKVAKTFMLGFAPNGWRNLLPYLKKKGYREKEIEQAGLAIRSAKGYYDRFRGRFMFTLRDHRGQTLGFSGRVLGHANTAKYINSPETPIYHKGSVVYGLDTAKDAIRKEDAAIIVEGEFDVLSAYQHGIANTIAIKGTALTRDQLVLIKRFTAEIRLALDMDVAGDSAARKGIEIADDLDLTVRIVAIPDGKDLDEALGSDSLAVKKAIKHASSVYDFVLSSAVGRHGTGDAIAKKRVSADVLPVYARIHNPIVRNHYVKLLAETLGVSEESVSEELGRVVKRSRTTKKDLLPTKQKQAQTLDERLEYHILSLILQGKDPKAHLQLTLKTLTIGSLSVNPVQRILSWLHTASDKDIQNVDNSLPNELIDTYNRAYLADIQETLSEKGLFEKELRRVIVALKKRQLRMKLSAIATNMKKGDNLPKLNAEFNAISQKLKALDTE